jgi:hypothetical protein
LLIDFAESCQVARIEPHEFIEKGEPVVANGGRLQLAR